MNQGAFGGTEEASKSSSNRILSLIAPDGGEIWEGTQSIRWSATGSGWQSGDTLHVEYSADGGATWNTVSGGESVGYDLGSFAWDTMTVPSCPRYRVRLTCNQDGGVEDESQLDFTIHGAGLLYYVNDSGLAGDVYCTAVGDDGNDGLNPGSPKGTIQGIIDTYDLEPGDTVCVDTGTYNLASNIAVGLGDGGSSGNPVVFMGTTDPAGTVLDRNAVGTTTSTTFSVTGNYVRMERFRCTRAWYGVYLVGTGGEVVNCEAYGNGSDGVRIEGPTGALNSVTGCLVRDNPGTGVCCYSSSSVSAVISDNVIRSNGVGIYCFCSISMVVSRNMVYTNTGDGIYGYAPNGTATLANNVIVNNGSRGLFMECRNNTILVMNNTISGNGSHGMQFNRTSYSGICNFRNNIVCAAGTGKACFCVGSTLAE